MIADYRSSAEERSRKAIITGIRGQDACLLARLLQSKGWEVLGTDKPSWVAGGTDFQGIPIDLSNRREAERLVDDYRPDCIFHLAAAHHSSEQKGGAEQDEEMVRTNFISTESLLLAITHKQPECRLLLAGSSQMYRTTHGGLNVVDEDTPVAPSTFYGHTKAWSRALLDHYRQQRGVFGSMMILFNHESPLRGPQFLTRKVTMAAARAFVGQPSGLKVRNIGASVDWSSAQDFVEAMERAMIAPEPTDYVLASGCATSVEALLSLAFGVVGLDWRVHTLSEGEPILNQPVLVGNADRARRLLGWQPRETLAQLIRRMVVHDLHLLGASLSRSR